MVQNNTNDWPNSLKFIQFQKNVCVVFQCKLKMPKIPSTFKALLLNQWIEQFNKDKTGLI